MNSVSRSLEPIGAIAEREHPELAVSKYRLRRQEFIWWANGASKVIRSSGSTRVRLCCADFRCGVRPRINFSTSGGTQASCCR